MPYLKDNEKYLVPQKEITNNKFTWISVFQANVIHETELFLGSNKSKLENALRY